MGGTRHLVRPSRSLAPGRGRGTALRARERGVARGSRPVPAQPGQPDRAQRRPPAAAPRPVRPAVLAASRRCASCASSSGSCCPRAGPRSWPPRCRSSCACRRVRRRSLPRSRRSCSALGFARARPRRHAQRRRASAARATTRCWRARETQGGLLELPFDPWGRINSVKRMLWQPAHGRPIVAGKVRPRSRVVHARGRGLRGVPVGGERAAAARVGHHERPRRATRRMARAAAARCFPTAWCCAPSTTGPRGPRGSSTSCSTASPGGLAEPATGARRLAEPRRRGDRGPTSRGRRLVRHRGRLRGR